MVIRRATREDLDRVASLLESEGRPPLPVSVPLANVLVALDDGAVVGVIALQVIGLRGLVGPEAVGPSHRETGVRTSLLQTLLARAHELSLRELYLLTEKDAEFFGAAGFAAVSPEAVPAEVASSRAYRDQRSDTAGVMRLQLVTRFV